jgi:site-specific recombinase XerD
MVTKCGLAEGNVWPAAAATGLAEDLAEQGYTPNSVEQHLRLLAQLGRWLDAEGLTPEQLTSADIGRFVELRRSKGYVAWRSLRGLAPVLGYLRRAGLVPMPAELPAVTPIEQVAAAYRRYLIEERGLAPATVQNYQPLAELFFSRLPGPVQANLACLSEADIRDFMLTQCRSHSVKWAKNLSTVVRSVLRFLFLEGQVPQDLKGSVLSVASWRCSGLPTGLTSDEVARLLATCDPRRRAGRRDLAILTLAVRLGVRAGEIAGLRLEDLDWRKGEILVRGKKGRQNRLPLPTDVGQAIVEYLQHDRPTTTSRNVFILAVAPRKAISRRTVIGVVRCACERAGVRSVAPHRLRHGAATEMLRRGAPLVEIGQILGHEHVETTSIYAKVDLAVLTTLAQPWPEVEA